MLAMDFNPSFVLLIHKGVSKMEMHTRKGMYPKLGMTQSHLISLKGSGSTKNPL